MKHLYRNELCTVSFFYTSVVLRLSKITDPDPDPDIKFVIFPGVILDLLSAANR